MNKKLINWSLKEYSHLPWRKKRTLYTTLVSEIMLQQTTVGTVLNHFDKFIKKYPTIKSLAKTTEEELTIQWKGLGYYRRARNLKKAAEYIVKEHKGKIPLDFERLVAIPGIGAYTANAILSIGADIPAIALDANLERVLARYYQVETPKGPKLNKELYSLFETGKICKKEFKKYSSRELNESLMDLGRNFCQTRKVSCEICPISKNCKSFQNQTQFEIPNIKEVKKQESFELDLLRVIIGRNGKVKLYQKNDKEWLSGQWELPTFILNSADKKLNQYPELIKKIDYKKLPKIKTAITKYKITNYYIELSNKEFVSYKFKRKIKFFNLNSDENLSTTTTKIFKKLSKL